MLPLYNCSSNFNIFGPFTSTSSEVHDRSWVGQGREILFLQSCTEKITHSVLFNASTTLFVRILPKQPLGQVHVSYFPPGDTTIDSATAHPHQTPDGSVINVSVKHGRISSYNVIEIPPSSGKPDESPLEGGKVLCSFPPTSGVGYMHSFCLTEIYVVVELF